MSTPDAAPARQPTGSGAPHTGAMDDPAAARGAMVARLEAAGATGPGPVRDALSALPREVLMPQAYVRRGAPAETAPRWDLLDWAARRDRPELLGLLCGGGSVLVQHDGEPLLDRVRGSRSGGAISSVSTVMGPTVALREELDLRPGLRVLDVGTGAGVTAALACQVCGDSGVVALDRQQHLTEAAKMRLAGLGFRPHVVCGTGDESCPAQTPFDRIFVSYTVRRVPRALVEQLAPGGRLRAHVTTASPSWPAVAARPRGRRAHRQRGVQAELRGVEFTHPAGHGLERIWLTDQFRQRITIGPGRRRTRASRPCPRILTAVSGRQPTTVPVGPSCGTSAPSIWSSVRPPAGRGCAPGEWAPKHGVSRLRGRATSGRNSRTSLSGGRRQIPRTGYRLDFGPDDAQRAVSACGGLSWQLPDPHPLRERAAP
ncbi:methyltransferase domain-containing protein [Streptomyces sp. BE308]|uniref:protein-L-isoaspartate O-methyltransferase family protein n=1 Tax=Streptomyces sp. BE308 TaxID=3002529 RepID=UPI002E7A44D5|nr:methyltransferase domain-containing protein [Streptomyces sp. BE308]MEE1790254.1 methyltransferase domain-containing protein [Streptomyces sp. BE308]